jgi:hypothetical protein
METKQFQFNGKTINFEVSDKNVMVNATEMAAVFGKKPDDFLKTKQTKAFINECCRDENYYELLGLKKEDFRINLEYRKNHFLRVVHGGRHNGTWMHRILALKFAAWLDFAFELWVFKTVDYLLFGSVGTLRVSVAADGKEREMTCISDNNIITTRI